MSDRIVRAADFGPVFSLVEDQFAVEGCSIVGKEDAQFEPCVFAAEKGVFLMDDFRAGAGEASGASEGGSAVPEGGLDFDVGGHWRKGAGGGRGRPPYS